MIVFDIMKLIMIVTGCGINDLYAIDSLVEVVEITSARICNLVHAC